MLGNKLLTVVDTGKVHVHSFSPFPGACVIPANHFAFSIFINGFQVIPDYSYAGFGDELQESVFTYLELYAMQNGLSNTPVENDQLPYFAVDRTFLLAGFRYKRFNSSEIVQIPNGL